MSADLFGQEVKRLPRTGGYAGTPGTGPAGMQCRHCDHYTVIAYHDQVYRKCGLVRATRGKGTDIQARAAACHLFRMEP